MNTFTIYGRVGACVCTRVSVGGKGPRDSSGCEFAARPNPKWLSKWQKEKSRLTHQQHHPGACPVLPRSQTREGGLENSKMDPFLIDSDFSDEDAPAARPDAAPAAEGDAPQPASAPHVEAPEALQTVVASPSPAAPAIGHDQGRSAAEGVQAQADATAEPAAEEPVDLERERQARIARNRQALQALGVAQAAAELREDRNDSTAVVKKKRTRQREPREAAPAPPVQLKRSRRAAGLPPQPRGRPDAAAARPSAGHSSPAPAPPARTPKQTAPRFLRPRAPRPGAGASRASPRRTTRTPTGSRRRRRSPRCPWRRSSSPARSTATSRASRGVRGGGRGAARVRRCAARLSFLSVRVV